MDKIKDKEMKSKIETLISSVEDTEKILKENSEKNNTIKTSVT
jgi:hypothetical protein